METIRLLLADDHEMVRKGLGLFIAGHDDLVLVGEANDIPSTRALATKLQPDLILMDLMMPGGSAVEAIAAIRQQHPQIKIIALTSFREPALVQQVIAAGALGFLYKDLSIDALIAAIRNVASGRPVLADDATQHLIYSLNPPPDLPQPVSLTPRERDVLALMVQGLTNRQIAQHLYLSPATIKQYVSTILSKLEATSRTEAVAIAIQRKLVAV